MFSFHQEIIDEYSLTITKHKMKKENQILMKNLLELFPRNITEALEIAANNPLKNSYPTFKNILICGLGGSGIGGKLVANWFKNELTIPIDLCQDYDIPNYVNNQTLVIACSYSGNTEETLSAVEQSHKKEASIIAVTSGGKLENYCKKFNYEYILVPGGNPPRTQLAFSIVQLTHVLSCLRLIQPKVLEDFKQSAELLIKEKSSIHAQAKKIAQFILNKDLIIYTQSKDEAIAIRARQQFNENAKILCSHHIIPEMNHNEIVGWAGGKSTHAVIFIHTSCTHMQNQKRFDFSKEVVQTKTDSVFNLTSAKNSTLEESLYLINIIDWASLYLSESMGVDPVEVRIIDKLKSSLN